MDYKVVSQQVVDNVGGLENIEGATHCVTRLRLVLKDTSKYNKAELENIDGVKGVLYNSGQLMIIFGTGTVNKVYDEFMALTGVKEISVSRSRAPRRTRRASSSRSSRYSRISLSPSFPLSSALLSSSALSR